MKRNTFILVCAGLALFVSCSRTGRFRTLHQINRIAKSGVTVGREKNAYRLTQDRVRLGSLSQELQDMDRQLGRLRKSVGIKKRGYYTADEHDRIEGLLFRYMACRASLWDMVDYYRAYRSRFDTPQGQVRGFILGYNAALHLAFYSSKLVNTFIKVPATIKKLNEAYYRSGIPAGTFDSLAASVTRPEHINAIEAAWVLYNRELGDRQSLLYSIRKSDPVYRGLIKQIRSLYQGASRQIGHIIKNEAYMLPRAENLVRRSRAGDLVRQYFKEWGDNLAASRAVLYENVSRLKSPTAALITFTDDQVAGLRSWLKPGDLILTFTAGYMSNIFLPGVFKHGITFVGAPEQRVAAGLTRARLDPLIRGNKEKVWEDLATGRLPDRHQADVIEAVAEGVIFNNLNHLLHTHINRMLVLRPKITEAERVAFLGTVFSLLGNGYDFKFDFTDASEHCCTEVIYRGLHARGPFRFPLTSRMGCRTLSADDLVNYYLKAAPEAFDLVYYVEEEKASPEHRARILTGEDGLERLKQVMARVKN